jgi:4-diphosphocytidyl-2-C-methyl-D-erythritol kinase
MLIQRDGPGVHVRTPAKVNLFLEVLHRRPDGYHELNSLMLAVSLHDTVQLRESRAAEVRLDCDLPGLSVGPDNLVARAANLIRERYQIRQGLEIKLHKGIPLQAGLAGGSSDGAATLAGLNELWQLGLPRSELMDLAAQLGSDCAFFLAGSALAWCRGRGEIVEPMILPKPLDLVLVKPGVGLSTADVFRGLVLPSQPLDGLALSQAVKAGDVEEIGRRLHNRLQPAAERLCPEVGRLIHQLADLYPAGQLMTGSGSTVYAVCRDSLEALRIARDIVSVWDEGADSRVFVVRSCD